MFSRALLWCCCSLRAVLHGHRLGDASSRAAAGNPWLLVSMRHANGRFTPSPCARTLRDLAFMHPAIQSQTQTQGTSFHATLRYTAFPLMQQQQLPPLSKQNSHPNQMLLYHLHTQSSLRKGLLPKSNPTNARQRRPRGQRHAQSSNAHTRALQRADRAATSALISIGVLSDFFSVSLCDYIHVCLSLATVTAAEVHGLDATRRTTATRALACHGAHCARRRGCAAQGLP